GCSRAGNRGPVLGASSAACASRRAAKGLFRQVIAGRPSLSSKGQAPQLSCDAPSPCLSLYSVRRKTLSLVRGTPLVRGMIPRTRDHPRSLDRGGASWG